jgi:hypothetical protein
MNIQLDLGNLAVGLATLTLAGVTIFIALRSNEVQKNQKIADYRLAWNESLRSKIAEFAELTWEKRLIYIKNKNMTSVPRELFEIDKRIMSIMAFVDMMLNEKESAHEQLMEYMQKVLLAGVNDEFTVRDVSLLGRKVLKLEWEKLKLEIRES